MARKKKGVQEELWRNILRTMDEKWPKSMCLTEDIAKAVAGSMPRYPLEESEEERINNVLNELEIGGDVIREELSDGRSLWRITELGKLHAEKAENFHQILAANYIRRLLEGKTGQDGQTNDPDYEGIRLLTVDARRSCGCDGMFREALVVPPDADENLLNLDVANGAYPFRSLLNMTETDKHSRVNFISVKRKEDGLKTVFYLYSRKADDRPMTFEGDYTSPENFRLECYDPDNDGSYQNVIPIITLDEIILGARPVSFPIEEFSFAGAINKPFVRPYWSAHCGPIIIINDSNGFATGEETLNDAILKVGENKSQIYVINVERDETNVENEEECIGDFIGKTRYLKAMVAHNASVYIIPEGDMDYRQAILKGLCHKYGIAIPDDYPVNELLGFLLKTEERMPSQFLDRMLYREVSKKDSKLLSKDLLALLGNMNERDLYRLRGWKLLDSLNGLTETKKAVISLVNALKMNKARKRRGLKNEPIVACLFAGAPGTAKTTIAQALADILADEGLLPGGRFTSVSGSGLQAEYVGQTSQKVRSIVKNTDVLLVDECYSLAQSLERNSPYASEALAELCVLMTEATEKEDKLFIFAGYGGTDSTEKNNYLKTFLNSNPGIKSRISAVINFPSYSGNEMADIFMKICENNEYSFDKNTVSSLKKDVEAYFEERISDPSFGNGREARNLLSEAVRIHAQIVGDKKVEEITDDELRIITADDVRNAIKSLRSMEEAREGKGRVRISLLN